MAAFNNPSNHHATATKGDRATSVARRLLRHLAPLFPNVRAATADEAGRDAWVHAWALQIRNAGLDDVALERGLKNVGQVVDRPLSWPTFLSLCRPRKIDVVESFTRTQRAVGAGNWYSISPPEYWALREWGFTDFREAQGGDQAVQRWGRLLDEASRQENLPSPPPRPAGFLAGPHPRELKKNQLARAKAMEALKAMRRLR